MLFSSSTDVISGLASVSNESFQGISVYVVLIAGIVLGFFIIERIVRAIFPRHYTSDNKQDNV
jgi:uncharacterized membrane protein